MFYYEVLTGSTAFHGSGALTYAYEGSLDVGNVVVIPLRNKPILGIVSRKVTKPEFEVKEIHRLVSSAPMPRGSLQLLGWLTAYYPAPLGVIVQQFLPAGLLRTARGNSRDTTPDAEAVSTTEDKAPLPMLTAEQQAVIGQIRTGDAGTVILHGDTGTGKTRVYMELVSEHLRNGRSSLILTPEIALTPQLVVNFTRHFGIAQVVVIHSNLTEAERRRVWLQILESTHPLIVIGPRSALFVPLHDIGLIVVDEAHENAYKQEQAPYYHASRLAARLSQLHGAQLILGSATPLITDYFTAQTKGLPILRMQQSATKSDTTSSVEVVNLRDRDQFTRQAHLSDKLLKSIERALARGEQSLVFLNRRGTARLVMCEKCGWQMLCPHCDVPLTYHADTHTGHCHTCGFQQRAATDCPECHSADIIFKSIGTKAITEELSRQFPQARVQRFDTDNTKAERIENHYADVHAGKVDILVGTQLLAKGLDLPMLSVVGVVLADTSLYFPDYTADERTFQLLTQVIGRVGRGHRSGTAVIQTYSPDSPAIQAAISKDWDSFYEQQITKRRQFDFPPFCHVLKLTCERASLKTAMSASDKLASQLRSMKLKVHILGPSPSFHERVRGKYRWQILIKSRQRSELLKIIPELPAKWTHDLDPTNLL